MPDPDIAKTAGSDMPVCQAPDLHPRKPAIEVPPGACDCHAHIFGDPARYRLNPKRHYTPAATNVDDYRHMLATLGLAHAVIIQPAVYLDNQVTLDVLAASKGAWRGIVLPDVTWSPQEVARLHDAGVRGVRFHPKSADDPKLRDLEAICARIADQGWHVQCHVNARLLTELGPRLRRLPVPVVFDHIGAMRPACAVTVDEPGFVEMLRMVDDGKAWVKLSAPFRFDDPKPPYPAVAPFAQALVRNNPDRLVWATDWPMTNFTGFMPNPADLLEVLAHWAPEAAVRKKILVDNAARLYGF